LEMISPEREMATLEELAQRVTDGETLAGVCTAWNIPYARIANWLESDLTRWQVYERALKLRADALYAATLAIADGAQPTIMEHTRKDGTVVEIPVLPDHQRDRLRTDVYHKVAAKWDRLRFGGETGVAPRPAKPVDEVTMIEAARRVAFALARGAHVAERARREPRLLEGKAEVEAEEAPATPGLTDDDVI